MAQKGLPNHFYFLISTFPLIIQAGKSLSYMILPKFFRLIHFNFPHSHASIIAKVQTNFGQLSWALQLWVFIQMHVGQYLYWRSSISLCTCRSLLKGLSHEIFKYIFSFENYIASPGK